MTTTPAHALILPRDAEASPRAYTVHAAVPTTEGPARVAEALHLDEACRASPPFSEDVLRDDPREVGYGPQVRLEDALAMWRAQCLAEVGEATHEGPTRRGQRMDATVTEWRRMRLDRRDGALYRLGGPGVPLTQHALSQLVGLVAQGLGARGLLSAMVWARPLARATLYLDALSRSRRGLDDEVRVRRYIAPERLDAQGRVTRPAQATIRAVLSGRHAAHHFDDSALQRLLVRELPRQDLPARISRTEGGTVTHLWCVVQQSPRAAGCDVAVSGRNSETGQARLAFRGSARIRALDAALSYPRLAAMADGDAVQLTTEVTVARADAGSVRNHTLPRVATRDLITRHGLQGVSPGDELTAVHRQQVADDRLSESWRLAVQSGRQLAEAWDVALAQFPGGVQPAVASREDRAAYAAVICDLLEDEGLSAGRDRPHLEAVLRDDARLDALPFLSAAHVAAAYAVLAASGVATEVSEGTGKAVKTRVVVMPRPWDDVTRLQALAGRWVLAGWDAKAHQRLGLDE